MCHVTEGDLSQFLFLNLYADIYCSDLTSCLSLSYMLKNFLACDLQHGHMLHTKMTWEGTEEPWLALSEKGQKQN